MNQPTSSDGSPPSDDSVDGNTFDSFEEEVRKSLDAMGLEAKKVEAKNLSSRLSNAMLVASIRGAQAVRERAAREAAKDAENAALRAEVLRMRTENDRLRDENEKVTVENASLREEVIHGRYAVGYYEEENAQLREALELPRGMKYLDYN